MAPYPGLARRPVGKTGQDVDEGGFTGAVGTEKAEKSPSRDVYGNVDQRLFGGVLASRRVSFAKVMRFDRVLGRV